jgi:hypothetical protein
MYTAKALGNGCKGIGPVAGKTRLPHPELAPFIAQIKRDVIYTSRGTIAGMDVTFSVLLSNLETEHLGACHDDRGTIYLPANLVELDLRYANLIAYYEHLGIQHKAAERNHAYAHRRAYVGELLEHRSRTHAASLSA